MTMNYASAKADCFAKGNVESGYFGKRVEAAWHLDKASSKIIEVTETGCHWSGMVAQDEAEAVWMLNNHPTATVQGRVIVESVRA